MANPYVTVVVLTMDYPFGVMDCLKDQTYKGFEVIFAGEKGIVKAMNAALKKANGEIFVRIDEDVFLPDMWLEELVTPFLSDPEIAGVTGPTFVRTELRKNRDSIKIWESPNWFLRWLQDNRKFAPAAIYKCGMVSYDSNYWERFNGVDAFECDHLEGTNWAMRTDLIRRVGGFDPAFDGVAEWYDTDVEAKIKKLGYSLLYNPKAVLWHNLWYSPNYNERFDGIGRIKNFLRYHKRHSKFHWKMIVYLIVWSLYFVRASWSKRRS